MRPVVEPMTAMEATMRQRNKKETGRDIGRTMDLQNEPGVDVTTHTSQRDIEATLQDANHSLAAQKLWQSYSLISSTKKSLHTSGLVDR